MSVISGMAYVRDRPQGQRRTLTEGYLLFENGLQVEVLKGAWSVTDSGGTSHRIVGMFENGRELRFMEVEVASLDEEIVLESYSYPGFFLNATTSDSKLISGYSVLQERDLHRGPRGEHPGSVSSCLMVVSRATGWSYLPETEASDGRYWVTAPGKTWGRIDEKEVSGDGAVTVVLEPAGTLQVGISNYTQSKNLRIIVRRERDASPVLDYVVHSESFMTIPGLVPGNYEAFLGFDPRPTSMERMSSIVGFTADPLQVATIELELLPTVARSKFGSLSMTVSVEGLPLWKEATDDFQDLGIVIRPLQQNPTFESLGDSDKAMSYRSMEDLDPENESLGLRAWNMGDYPPGQYEYEVHPLEHRGEFVVESAEHSQVNVTVPAPGIVLATFTYQGRPVSGVHVMRGLLGAPDSKQSAAVSNLEGVARVVLLPGAHTLMAIHRLHGIQEHEISVASGWNTLNWSFPEPLEIMLSATDAEGKPITMTREVCWGFEFVATGFDGHCISKQAHFPKPNGLATVTFSKPGRYRVQTKDAFGWKVIGEPSIRVGPGGKRDWAIKLGKRDAVSDPLSDK